MKNTQTADLLTVAETPEAPKSTDKPRLDTMARAIIRHCIAVMNDDHATGAELAELEGWLVRLEALSAEEILRFVPAAKSSSYLAPTRISELHARRAYEWWDTVIAERNAAANGVST